MKFVKADKQDPSHNRAVVKGKSGCDVYSANQCSFMAAFYAALPLAFKNYALARRQIDYFVSSILSLLNSGIEAGLAP